jgi:Zn-dependent metalloprotease
MLLVSTVHYGKNFDNAMWNGSQMVYGDGDGKLFNRFTIAQDVIGHELTHGVTQHTAALEYRDQSGALNEHVSDVMGIMVKQWVLGQTAAQSDWLIGAGLFAPGVHGKAIRSMKAPGSAYNDPALGRDPQPAHMRNYVTSADDNGGVHINSGIPNHAFYLVATALGGNAWDVAGWIWYDTLQTKLSPTAGFQDFAAATVIVAGEKYGVGSTIQITVAEAWSQVGLPLPPSLTQKKHQPPSRMKWRDRPLRRKAA